MADVKRAVPENVPGDFFVDETCIDCDTCRQLAPRTFEDAGDYSFVYQQPASVEQEWYATLAMLACPTGSIGSKTPKPVREAANDFPIQIDDTVCYCGFTSAKSFGASSYFIQHPDGNWLIDTPRFIPLLVNKFELAGGIDTIFLSHSDDVADAEKFAEHFGAKRIIHQLELDAQPGSEIVIEGIEPLEITPDFTVIPTPGHTPGHCSLLYKSHYLFSGDHLWWDRFKLRLDMPTHYVWNQDEQIRSAETLLKHTFEWLLPGHGQRIRLPKFRMDIELKALIERKMHELVKQH
jgi:glyoxylase-like metal-dependent hydrolase (beta-lactamase superfamily II)/ferredoxin